MSVLKQLPKYCRNQNGDCIDNLVRKYVSTGVLVEQTILEEVAKLNKSN